MNAVRVDRIAATWESFQAASGLGHIANERHYDQVIELMNRIADDGAMDPAHRLHGMFMLAADLVRQYEQEAYPAPDISGVEMLRFLMDHHDLRQTDFAQEIGSQGVVSEILSGKRDLNKSHIAALSKRFSVSPAVFF